MSLEFSLVIATTVLSSCQKEVMTTTGSVSGQILSGTGNGIGNPVPGVKLYLWNLSIKPDTVNYKNNLKAIADSTVTDNTGKYAITNIPEGKWGISPVFDQTDSKVNLDTSGDSVIFSIPGKKKDYNVNFLMSPPNNDFDHFHIKFNFSKRFDGSIEPFRRQFSWFVEYYLCPYNVDKFKSASYYTTLKFDYGFWRIIDGVTNEFEFKFNKNETWQFTAEIKYSLSFCPANSTYDVDIEAKTCKWVKDSIDGY